MAVGWAAIAAAVLFVAKLSRNATRAQHDAKVLRAHGQNGPVRIDGVLSIFRDKAYIDQVGIVNQLIKIMHPESSQLGLLPTCSWSRPRCKIRSSSFGIQLRPQIQYGIECILHGPVTVVNIAFGLDQLGCHGATFIGHGTIGTSHSPQWWQRLPTE
jgi:hypothetical protein